MTDGNGFDEYKKFYEEKFRVNDEQHKHIIAGLDTLNQSVSKLDKKVERHSAWWAAFWGGVLLATNLLAPVIMGGCNAG